MRGNVLLAVLTLLVAVCLLVPALVAGWASGRTAGRPLRGAAGPVLTPEPEIHHVRRIVAVMPVMPAEPGERVALDDAGQAPAGEATAGAAGTTEEPPAR